MRILAGDIGGTKTLLQLIDVTASDRAVMSERRFESNDYASFDDVLREFIANGATVDAACFAVAGPVMHGAAQVTNLGWKMDADALSASFAIPRIALINDFFAVGLGVPLLAADDLVSLQAGVRVDYAPIAILGAGTGLGQAAVIYERARWEVIPSEGGHADFAPQDEEQARLLVHLLAKYPGHVSWERVISGMGIENIYEFLTGQTQEASEIAALAAAGDEAAVRTMRMFVDVYGAEAGNMALRLLARGGVYLAGGIAAKNVSSFTDGRFIEAFVRKGRYREYAARVPVDLIINPNVGLIGAGEMAARLVESA